MMQTLKFNRLEFPFAFYFLLILFFLFMYSLIMVNTLYSIFKSLPMINSLDDPVMYRICRPLPNIKFHAVFVRP